MVLRFTVKIVWGWGEVHIVKIVCMGGGSHSEDSVYGGEGGSHSEAGGLASMWHVFRIHALQDTCSVRLDTCSVRLEGGRGRTVMVEVLAITY